MGKHPTVERLAQSIQEKKQCRIYVDGLSGSSTALIFASLNQRQALPHTLYILDDEEEAGYFYHDLTQIMTGKNIMFFPSSYRQAIRNAQKDPANEVLRTDVLVALTNQNDNTTEGEILNIVTYPEAIKELVISQNTLKSNTQWQI